MHLIISLWKCLFSKINTYIYIFCQGWEKFFDKNRNFLQKLIFDALFLTKNSAFAIC